MLLDVQDLCVAFGGREVVSGVNFQLRNGEKLALVGESGSGKTLTALSLLGLAGAATVSGRVLLQGRDVLALSEADRQLLRGADIAMVSQEPMTALNPLMTVGDQLAEVFHQKKGLALSLSRSSAIELLESVGLDDAVAKAQAHPHQLSGGQRQRVLMAMALACNPKVLLADEPTTALDVTLRQHILDLLATQQRERGMAVLLITHDLNLVRHFADRVLVMQNGRVVEQGPVQTVLTAPQHPYTRLLLDSRPVRTEPTAPMAGGAETEHTKAPSAPEEPAEAVVSVRDLRVTYPTPLPGWKGWFLKGEAAVLQDVSFGLWRGRTLGVVGESGSGKTSLALALLDLIPYKGQVLITGQPWARRAADNRAQRRRVQVVFQDPFSSLSPRMTVAELVGEGLAIHEPQLTPAQRQARVLAALQAVGLPDGCETQGAHAPQPTAKAIAPGPNDRLTPEQLLARYPHEFSGGQRQRLAIARALVVNPEVLVLDEPTSALDVTVQKQVVDLLLRLQRDRGLSYLLITHDMNVVQAMAHDVLVLQGGRVVEQGAWAQVRTQPAHPHTQALLNALA